jgi:hypothetical protein
MGFAENWRLLLQWDSMHGKGGKRDDQMGVVDFLEVKEVQKKRKKKLKGWLGAGSTEERKWVGEQNMGSKYKENFLGGTKELFWGDNVKF